MNPSGTVASVNTATNLLVLSFCTTVVSVNTATNLTSLNTATSLSFVITASTLLLVSIILASVITGNTLASFNFCNLPR